MNLYISLYDKTNDPKLQYEILGHAWNEGDRYALTTLCPRYREYLLTQLKTFSRKKRPKPEERQQNETNLQRYWQTYLMTSHYIFADFMMYLEHNRPVHERFYQPRARCLAPIVTNLQLLADDHLDELFISQPARTGKTALIQFFCIWCFGRDSERTNLYSSCTDTNTEAFYRGILETLKDDTTYCFEEIFPHCQIADTNGKKTTLNMGRVKKYATMTCRSIGGTLNGSCDCNGLLISDDLVTGIETVLSPGQLPKLWQLVDNNLLTRAKENCKILWIGTRWSLQDPIGRRIDLLENSPEYKTRRYKIINVPALDKHDHSNFEYDFGVGFSSDYYQQRRASFERNGDMASWLAQYMGEPVERSGALFDPSDMKFYNGKLPPYDPISITATVDLAWGGGDNLSMPIAYEYDDGSVFIHDVVFSPENKRITIPMMVNACVEHNITLVDIEKINGADSFIDEFKQALEKRDCRVPVLTHTVGSTKAKEVRIFDTAPMIRDFYFRDQGTRNAQYTQFMNEVYAFKILGKNKHDDAVDSLAMLVNRLQGRRGTNFRVVKRPF